MDRTIYQLCTDYVKTYDLLSTLIQLNIGNHERLVMFRLCQERLTLLEKELFDTLVEQEI